MLCYNYGKEPPQNSAGNYLGFYMSVGIFEASCSLARGLPLQGGFTSCITLRALSYRKRGIFLLLGTAGFYHQQYLEDRASQA